MSAQDKFDKHIHLSEFPRDSQITLEFWVKREKKASKTRKRTFLSFRASELKEMRIVVKGRKKLIWTPFGLEDVVDDGKDKSEANDRSLSR